ncbi:TPA: hypothetical protein MAN53_004040 [Klebsiella pneumoniae]|uniref:hypothetical protein n=1 Tax=Klebsiella pneumoniae TaxID=573 RepID=UPI0009BC32BB|nr:hypothetical protein [Klebsiella pneumoniae]SLO54055.1 Uncharacterised protein [Klebsiella pneumoniae]HBS6726851.1 hypothetical protein [Klebsiella pneumoniae]
MKRLLIAVALLASFGASAKTTYHCEKGITAIINYPSLTVVKDGITIASAKSEYDAATNEQGNLVENLSVRTGDAQQGTYSEFILVHTGGIKNGLSPIVNTSDNGGDAVLLIGGQGMKDIPFKCHRSGFNTEGNTE